MKDHIITGRISIHAAALSADICLREPANLIVSSHQGRRGWSVGNVTIDAKGIDTLALFEGDPFLEVRFVADSDGSEYTGKAYAQQMNSSHLSIVGHGVLHGYADLRQ